MGVDGRTGGDLAETDGRQDVEKVTHRVRQVRVAIVFCVDIGKDWRVSRETFKKP